MSVIIIGGGGKAAINVLQAACAKGNVTYDEAQEANAAINVLIALAKAKCTGKEWSEAQLEDGEESNDE